MKPVITEEVKTNCRQFNGYKPCSHHKKTSAHCSTCTAYDPIGPRILLIKTGAAGEVLRNTPLLARIKKLYPNAEVHWLTKFPDLVPQSVDKIYPFTWESVELLAVQEFDLVLSLDKEPAECALATRLKAKEKRGFILNSQGRIIPAQPSSERKWQTGVFDDLMKSNRKHYVQELFEICGWDYEGETYQIDPPAPWNSPLPAGSPLIGLNTGAGKVWTTRIWPESSYEKLICILQQKTSAGIVLLGGPEETERNERLAQKTGVTFPGVRPLREFLSLVNTCDTIVTSVTMTLHIAIALKKKTILLNSIFPSNEFHLYGLGEILEPHLPCQSCYKPRFDAHCPTPNCMDKIQPEHIFEALCRQNHRLR